MDFLHPRTAAAANAILTAPNNKLDDTDPVNAATVAEIERNEGCVLHAYQDSVGVWTIGYGHTGTDVHPGLVISQAQAEALMRADLEKFENGVDDLIGENVSTSDNQFGAMVSLAYNVGLGNFGRSSVLRFHNTGQHQAAANAFLMWDHAGGRILSGLLRRRQEEARIYLTPDK